MIKKIKAFIAAQFKELVSMNDTPHRIALGLGMGVFLGILPGTGPVAAAALAFVLPMNKAAALIGSLLTNTWLSIAVLFFSIDTGAFIWGVDGHAIEGKARTLVTDFSWGMFTDPAWLGVLKVVVTGFVVAGFLCGLMTYSIAFILLKLRQRPVD